MVKTKIICTLGPASSNEGAIRKMIMAGMDVVRLNCSHGSLGEFLSCIRITRKINRKYRRHVRVLLDLEGPRIRVGRLRGHNPVFLKKRQILWLSQGNIHKSDNVIPFDYDGPLASLRGAGFIYIDDGNIVLKIKEIGRIAIKTEVVVGGALKEYKGINIPGAHLEFSDISEKDKKGGDK